MGAGLATVGLCSYTIFFALGRRVPPHGSASFAAFWAAAFGGVQGVFVPFEHSLVRALVGRLAGPGQPDAARRAITAYLTVAAVTSLAVIATAKPLAAAIFKGDVAMSYTLAVFIPVFGPQSHQTGRPREACQIHVVRAPAFCWRRVLVSPSAE